MFLNHWRVICFVLLLCSLGWAGSAAAERYEIDPDHSMVIFKVKHLGISTVTGSFLEFSGFVDFDPEQIAAASAEAEIKAASVDSRNKKRDDHVRNEDFLDVAKYPVISFKSEKVLPGSDGHFQVAGTLSLHGVSKPVTLDAEFTGKAIDPWGVERVGFTATTAIDRKEFNVQFGKLMDNGGLVVGNDVRVTLEIEAKRKPQP